jgi:hypothetical protein
LILIFEMRRRRSLKRWWAWLLSVENEKTRLFRELNRSQEQIYSVDSFLSCRDSRELEKVMALSKSQEKDQDDAGSSRRVQQKSRDRFTSEHMNEVIVPALQDNCSLLESCALIITLFEQPEQLATNQANFLVLIPLIRRLTDTSSRLNDLVVNLIYSATGLSTICVYISRFATSRRSCNSKALSISVKLG